MRECKPPFSPDHVVGEFATLLKSYGVSQISGDRFANVWPVEVFAKVGMTYEQNAEPKSTLYTNMLQLLNSRVELLDEPRSIAQLCSLERRTARSGRELDRPSSRGPRRPDQCRGRASRWDASARSAAGLSY